MPNHRDTMITLAREQGWRKGIELGLGSGQLFHRFLHQGVEMIGVDLGARPDRRRAVTAMVADYGRIARVHWCSTHEAARLVPDGWADFVFIDAAHSLGAVREDIRDWLPKVKPGGWFGGHDFHPKFPGVMQAVREAFGESGFELLDGFIWARKRKAEQC